MLLDRLVPTRYCLLPLALESGGLTSPLVSCRYSERSLTKCIGITIETRPDYCLRPHLNSMLDYGCTRLEIGVQSVYEDVARDTNRSAGGHCGVCLFPYSTQASRSKQAVYLTRLYIYIEDIQSVLSVSPSMAPRMLVLRWWLT